MGDGGVARMLRADIPAGKDGIAVSVPGGSGRKYAVFVAYTPNGGVSGEGTQGRCRSGTVFADGTGAYSPEFEVSGDSSGFAIGGLTQYGALTLLGPFGMLPA